MLFPISVMMGLFHGKMCPKFAALQEGNCSHLFKHIEKAFVPASATNLGNKYGSPNNGADSPASIAPGWAPWSRTARPAAWPAGCGGFWRGRSLRRAAFDQVAPAHVPIAPGRSHPS